MSDQVAHSHLAARAADYLGMSHKPRYSVKVGPHTVLTVFKDGFVSVFSIGPNGGERGEWFKLTPTRLAEIRAALNTIDDDDPEQEIANLEAEVERLRGALFRIQTRTEFAKNGPSSSADIYRMAFDALDPSQEIA